jgi:protein O-GlcNAc transferase
MLHLAEQLLNQGKFHQAQSILADYCNSHLLDAHATFLHGACMHQIGKLDEALQLFELTLELQPYHEQAGSAKGTVLSLLGRNQEALLAYRKSLLTLPNDPQVLLNIAIVLEQIGDLPGALEAYEVSLKHHPEFASALLNRGVLQLRMGLTEDALICNQTLVKLYPGSEHAQFNLGEVNLVLGRWNEALAAYECALAINPHFAKAYFASGIAMSMLKRFDQAKSAFLTSESLDPEGFEKNISDAASLTGGEIRKFSPKTIYLLKESSKIDICNWDSWHEFVQELEELIKLSIGQEDEVVEPELLFRICALPFDNSVSLALAKSVSTYTTDKSATIQKFKFIPHKNKKLKIGYVSPDFKMHPIATVTRKLYGLHDRDQFEIYGYTLQPDDGSQIRKEIEQGCDIFRDLSELTDEDAAEWINRDEIDILIDLAGYTKHARPGIFAMRPAPIQTGYLGFLHTTGSPYLDYYIADQHVLPVAFSSKFFTEKIAYIPNSYFLFDNQQEISADAISRESLDLPENGFVFCCHNSNYKITPADFDIWMKLLNRVPDSVLWLYKSNEQVAINLRKEADKRGINPDRLIFAKSAPHDVYLARYRFADLFLDTQYYNAQTTAAEALWAGLPVITCSGETMASRVASGLLTAIGLTELIAVSPQQYEDLAYKLATQPKELARIKVKLQQNKITTTLFDTAHQVKKIEAAYLSMWQRYKSGLAPETFHISL